MLAPRQQVEACAASERRAVDVTGDAFAQQHRDGVFDGVQSAGRNGVLVRLHQSQVVVRDHVAVGAGFRIDVAHIRRLYFGVVQLEAFHHRLVFRHVLSFRCCVHIPLFTVRRLNVNRRAMRVGYGRFKPRRWNPPESRP